MKLHIIRIKRFVNILKALQMIVVMESYLIG